MKHQKTTADRFRALIAYDPLAGLRKRHRKEGGRVGLASHIDEQAKVVDTHPTDGQKEAGNYRKGHVKVNGLHISIENPRGSYREGGPPERRWRSRLPHHYGYIRKTEGGDGDHVDCYIGHHLKSPNVFVIDQHHLNGEKAFDEHKCFIGFGSKTQAKEAYHRAFSDGKGKDRIGHIETMTIEQFKRWLAHGDTKSAVRRSYAEGGAVADPNDLSDQYNTTLSPSDEAKFQAWAANNPNLGNTYDYDARGFWQAGAGTSDNGHGSDQWKKPNHPTFSSQSQYSAGDTQGGTWTQKPDASWSYSPSSTNLKYNDVGDLQDYFSKVEPTNQLIMPVQPQAAGGRVKGYADGGAPVTDPDVLAQLNAPTPVTDPKILEQLNAPAGPDRGGLNAAASGAAQGATFGFSDELRGLQEAGGAKPDEPASLAGTIKGAYKYWKGDPDAEKRYNEAVERERAADELAKSQHPYLHAAGEIAGSLPAMAALPEANLAEGLTGVGKAAAKIVEGAITGGEYGAVSGVGQGHDAESRITGGLEGTASGIIGGGVAGGLSNAVSEAAAPVVGAIRAARDPEKEAATRLTRALQADQDLIASGKAEGMSPTDWIAARSRGEPVTLADLGSSNTQALLRSSANTSPEGRAILEKALNDRFAGQTERVADEVRGLVAGGANANKTADQLVAEYDKARAPAYNLAYKQGANEITSPVIDRLTESPRFAKAMSDAESSVRDRAIVNGLIPPKPGVKNLQYWDAVKQELDAMSSVAGRSGDKGTADVAGRMAKQLRDELDKQVPSYANARGIASQYFGESNALEAGRKLAGKRVDPQQITDVMRKMKPDERELFREGYASDWANRVISNISDSRDITKAMFNSPNERARALAVFGQAGMDKMEARMSLETIMDGARKAMGNSTTARQLIEAGLAGGITGYETGDWKSAALAAGTAGMVPKVLGTTITQGAQKLIGKVDSRTARMVAELLTSDDPARLQQGLRMAQKNPSIKAGLMNMASKIGLAGQQNVGSRLYVSPMQGPVPASGGNEQQKP